MCRFFYEDFFKPYIPKLKGNKCWTVSLDSFFFIITLFKKQFRRYLIKNIWGKKSFEEYYLESYTCIF